MKQPLELTNDIEVDLNKDAADAVTSKILSSQNQEGDDSFFVCDLGDVVQKYKLWTDLLPQVKPYFDVKCNNDAAVLTVLSQLDVGFNCSSKNDVKMVLDRGISTSRLIYSSTCKLTSHIKFAASHEVDVIVFESETELRKIKSFHPNARLLLKVLPLDNANCIQPINFGCPFKSVPKLLSIAKQLQLNVIGVSIQTKDMPFTSDSAARAVALAHSIFEIAEGVGFNMTVLDIGEIFTKPSSVDLSLNEIFSMLQLVLDNYFPEQCGVMVIAEAARFFVESAFTLVVKVVDKTVITDDLDGFIVNSNENDLEALTSGINYYIGDGVYKSFSGILYDGLSVKPSLFNHKKFDGMPQFPSRLLGPSNDTLDCIVRSCYLPELSVGDWLLFSDMGAYVMTGSMASLDDHEMARPKCHYTMCAKDWIYLCCCSTVAGFSQSSLLPINAEPMIDWYDA